MRPSLPSPGQAAELVIESPSSDSIVLESANGLDRYWAAGPELRVRLTSDFGDARPAPRFAERWNGRLLDVAQRPATIRTCRRGRCREFSHQIPLKLEEPNARTVSLTAGWSSVFARRSITGGDRTVLFKEVLQSGAWTFQGDWASRNWSAQVQGFVTSGERGGFLDLSRVLKHAAGTAYGVAMHAGVVHSDWLSELGSPVVTGRAVYRAGIGPSVMLRGITASYQFGVSTDGRETLQIMSTRISANGNLTAVRQPVTLTAEKTFALGGGGIVPRRREALESFSAAVHLVDGVAVRVGVASRRTAWPDEQPADELRGSETLLTFGGQYSLTW